MQVLFSNFQKLKTIPIFYRGVYILYIFIFLGECIFAINIWNNLNSVLDKNNTVILVPFLLGIGSIISLYFWIFLQKSTPYIATGFFLFKSFVTIYTLHVLWITMMSDDWFLQFSQHFGIWTTLYTYIKNIFPPMLLLYFLLAFLVWIPAMRPIYKNRDLRK